MRALTLAMAATVALAAPAGAEPAKTPARNPGQAVEEPAVLIAAAEIPQAQQPQQPQQAPDAARPAKPARHARITTCRCGDQDPGE